MSSEQNLNTRGSILKAQRFMPSLETVFLDHDLTLLKAIAAQAGVELTAPNARAAATQLAQALLHPEVIELLLSRILPSPLTETFAPDQLALKDQTELALKNLIAQQRTPVAAFTRRFGEVRPLGPAALAREKPWENPATATEALYYNGLIGRGFFETESGPQEFFFVPQDLIPFLPTAPDVMPPSPAEAVSVHEEESAAQAANAGLADDAITVLATIQMRHKTPDPEKLARHLRQPAAFNLLLTVLTEQQLLTPDLHVDSEKARPFMHLKRGETLHVLAQTWRNSTRWNDLWHVPTLKPEAGAWQNDPLAARQLILKLCAELPLGEWRSLDSFLTFIKEHHADFQRHAGDYDSWYIREARTGEYLRGFANWDAVDGALVRYIITGPMHWLGLVHLKPEAFRLTKIFGGLLDNVPFEFNEKPAKMTLRSDGALIVPFEAHRYERFQAARIGEWMSLTHSNYVYRLTGNSLNSAGLQGITAKHIISFLRRNCDQTPHGVIEAIDRWGRNGVEVHAAPTTIVRFANAELLELVRHAPKAKPFLGEVINRTTLEVHDWKKLQEVLLELGLVAESE